MAKLMVHQFVSLDGYAADADGDFSLFENGEAHTPEFDLELLVRLQLVDAILLGATTYRMFAGYWPTPASVDQLVAPAINTIEKIVFSSTLDEAPWGEYAPARVESGDAVEIVRQLKEDRFGDLIVWGSLSLTDALFAAGLVDSVRIAVLPVILGSGRSAFPNGFTEREVRLIATNTFDNSIVATEYSVGSHVPTVTGAIAAPVELPDVAPEPEPEPLPERLFESDSSGEAHELPLPEAGAPDAGDQTGGGQQAAGEFVEGQVTAEQVAPESAAAETGAPETPAPDTSVPESGSDATAPEPGVWDLSSTGSPGFDEPAAAADTAAANAAPANADPAGGAFADPGQPAPAQPGTEWPTPEPSGAWPAPEPSSELPAPEAAADWPAPAQPSEWASPEAVPAGAQDAGADHTGTDGQAAPQWAAPEPTEPPAPASGFDWQAGTVTPDAGTSAADAGTPQVDDSAAAENPPLDPEEAERLVSRRKWD